MIECPNCHAACPDGDKFCRHCGYSLAGATPVSAAAPETPEPEAPAEPEVPADPETPSEPADESASQESSAPVPPKGQIFVQFKEGTTANGATHVTFTDVATGHHYSYWYKGATDYTLHIKFNNMDRVYLADCPNGRIKKVYYAYSSYDDYLADRKASNYGHTFLSHAGMIFIIIFMVIMFAVILGIIFGVVLPHMH